MSAVQEIMSLLGDYQKSNHELMKFSIFMKCRSRSKQSDLSSFCNVSVDKEAIEKELSDLIKESNLKSWNILIHSYHIEKNRISLKLLRTSLLKSVLLEIFKNKTTYGSSGVFNNKLYKIHGSECRPGLTRLRMTLAIRVISGLVTMGGGSVITDEQDLEVETIHLTHKNNSCGILVSPVKVSSGLDLSEVDFVRLRTEDMLVMGDHKELSEQSVQQLVDAAIVFDLLSIKLEKPLILDVSSEPKAARKSNCKGACFVLYNYARLCAILERFEHYVNKAIYKPLASPHDVDYSLLSDEDEWSLVFDFLSEWPALALECQDLTQPKMHRITGFLSALASTFSVYYRHTRVLNEGLVHLQPLMQARVHLLFSIKQVFLNAFSLLGIKAPTAM